MRQKVELTDFRIRPNASVNELKQFQEGHIWRDIETYLKVLNNESLVMLKTETDKDVLLRTQGCILVAEKILDLPNQLIEWAEEDQQSEDEGDEDDG